VTKAKLSNSRRVEEMLWIVQHEYSLGLIPKERGEGIIVVGMAIHVTKLSMDDKFLNGYAAPLSIGPKGSHPSVGPATPKASQVTDARYCFKKKLELLTEQCWSSVRCDPGDTATGSG
jgi:hypothetical protein